MAAANFQCSLQIELSGVSSAQIDAVRQALAGKFDVVYDGHAAPMDETIETSVSRILVDGLGLSKDHITIKLTVEG